MKSRLKLFLVIVIAIVTSSGATYFLVNRNGLATIAQFDSRWEALPNGKPSVHLDTGWRESPVTDNLTGKSSTEYATPMTTLDGPANLTGQLRVRCKDNSLDIFIVFSGFFSTRNSFWSVSHDGTILSTLNYAKAAGEGRVMFLDSGISELLNHLTEDGDLRLQVSVVDGPKITMKPDMQRGVETIAKVRAECTVSTPKTGPQQLTGRVTASNFKQFSSFIVDNYENIVELKISIGKSKSFEDPLQSSDDGKKFVTYMHPDSTIEISILGGYLYERGLYNFRGSYRVKWRALLQGAAIVELEQLVENQVRRDTPIKSVELKE